MPDLNENRRDSALWGFWATVLWGWIIMGVFLGSQLLVYWVVILRIHGAVTLVEYARLFSEYAQEPLYIFISFTTAVLCAVPAILIIIRLKKNSHTYTYLDLNKVNLKEFLRWSGVVVLFWLVEISLAGLLGMDAGTGYLLSPGTGAVAVMLMFAVDVILGPVFEELYYRGFLLKGLSRTFLKPAGAVLVTSIIWSLNHIPNNIFWIFMVFAMGLLLGFIKLRTNSMVLIIGLHMLYNLLSWLEDSLVMVFGN